METKRPLAYLTRGLSIFLARKKSMSIRCFQEINNLTGISQYVFFEVSYKRQKHTYNYCCSAR